MLGPKKSKHAGGHMKPLTEKQKRKAADARRKALLAGDADAKGGRA